MTRIKIISRPEPVEIVATEDYDYLFRQVNGNGRFWLEITNAETNKRVAIRTQTILSLEDMEENPRRKNAY